MVKEVQCKDVNCVPIETLIILINVTNGLTKYKGKVLKPLIEVLEQDIADLEIKEVIRMDELESEFLRLQSSVSAFLTQPRLSVKEKEAFSNRLISGVSKFSSPSAEPSSSRLVVMRLKKAAGEGQREHLSSSTFPGDKTSQSVPEVLSRGPVLKQVTADEDEETSLRHKKGGTRPRACPCCDPDNIDNIVDRMLFLNSPPYLLYFCG